MPDKGDSPHNTMDPIIVTIPGVEKLVKNIKPYKATGPDSISARLLNELSVQLAPALTYINHSWRGTRRLEDGPCSPHLQEGRQEQVLKLQACVTDIDMLQTYGTHTPQQHHITL